jgi:hypothetical protein
VDRPTKNNFGFIFGRYSGVESPDGKSLSDVYVLKGYVDGRYMPLYKGRLIGTDSCMFTQPNTAGILLRRDDKDKYEKRAAKLVQGYDKVEKHEKALFTQVSTDMKADSDLAYDHILFTYPEAVEPWTPATSDGTIQLDDTVFYTVKKELPQANKSMLDMTGTFYILTIIVGIQGTKRPLLETSAPSPTNAIMEKIKGMTLSP